MRIVRRILRIFGYLVVLSLALVIGAGAVLTLTAKGRENLAGLISSMASSPDSGVAITGISGIWSGPLTIDSVVLSDKDGPWLAARGVAVDWSFWPLLSSRVEASLVHADRVELARLPKSGESGSWGSGGLPVSLKLDRIDLPEILLDSSLAGEVAKVSGEGSLLAEAEPMTVTADLKVQRSDGKQGAVDARIDFAPAEDRLAIDLHGSEPAGGIIANFLQLPGAPPVEISLSGNGPAANWNLAGTFSVDGAVVTRVAGKRQRAEKGNRAEAKGEGAFARFVPKEFADLFAGSSNLDFAGTIGDDGALEIERATLESAALTAHAVGSIYPSGVSDLSVELAARDTPAALIFGEGDAAVALAIKAVSVRAFGPGGAPILDATASLDKLATADVELSGIEATLHSDAFNMASRSGPLTLSATAASGASSDNTIAALLAGVLKLEAAATLASDRLHVDSGSFASDTVGAALSGHVALADGSLKLDAKVNLLAAVLPEAARPALDRNVAVTATVARDASGGLRVDPLAIASGDFTSSGSVAFAAGALDARLQGSLADLKKFSSQLAGAVAFDVTAKGSPSAPDFVARITSERLSAAGREVAALELSADGTVNATSPSANLSIKGNLAGKPLAAKAAIVTANGQRRLDGLLVTLGDNSISGALALDEALIPEGTLSLALPDLAPLATLVPETISGALNGTLKFSRADGAPHIAVEANAVVIERGDLMIKGADVTAEVANYLIAPAITGRVKALTVKSGATELSNVDLSLSSDGAWTGFAGGATIADIAAKATGRLAATEGTTTVELATASASTRGLNATLAQPTIVTVKGGAAALDRLTLALGDGTVEVSGTAAGELDLDLRLNRVSADMISALAPQVKASGTASGTVKISGDPSMLATKGTPGQILLGADLAADRDPIAVTIGQGDGAVVLMLKAAALRGSGGGGAAIFDLSASLDKVATPDVELTGIEAKLHSDGFDVSAATGPLTISATAASGGSDDDTIAALLAGALKLDAAGTLAADSMHIDSGTFASDTVTAAIAGDASLADGSLRIDAKADMLASVLPAVARPALGTKVSATATVVRDTSGGFRLDPLTIASGGFTSTGSVAYATNALDAHIQGSLADLEKFSSEIAGAAAFDITAKGAPSAPDFVAKITSEKLSAAGREVTGLEIIADGKANAASPTANLAIKGEIAGKPLAAKAVVVTANGQRRIDGLSLTLGDNSISGTLALDGALVPEGTLSLALPDLGPLAALLADNVSGALDGTVRFSRADSVPQVAVSARSASIQRGDLEVKSAEVTAEIANYLIAPAVTGKVKALSVKSGATELSNIDVSLTRDGDWTGFAGGATIADIIAKATGRVALADGMTTVELATASASTRGLDATLAQPTTVTVKDGAAALDRLTLALGEGTVEVTGTAAGQLDLDLRLSGVPADIVAALAPGVRISGAISGTARVSGDPAALTTKGAPGQAAVMADLSADGDPIAVTIGEGAASVALTLKATALQASGSGGVVAFDLSAILDKVVTSDVELAGVEAKLHSDGFDVAGRTGPLTVSAAAATGGSVNETIAAALAGALRLDVAATLAADGIHLDAATFASDTVKVATSGGVSLADGALKLDVNADVLSVLLPAAARPALEKNVKVTATLVRDAAGALRVDPLAVVSGAFDATGSVSYAPDALDAQLKGGFADLAKLAPDTSGAIGFEVSAKGSPAAPDIVATISSDRLTAAGREITGLELTASGKADAANPAASVTVKGNVAGEALAGGAVLKTSSGVRRIDGLSLTLGNNKVSGDLVLDDAFVPEGALAFVLPDIGPLAALAFDKASGAIEGKVQFSRVDGVPQVAIDAKAASIERGDLSVRDAVVTAQVADYLQAPVVSGKVKALTVKSGTTVVSNVDLSLTRDGSWTGFSGGATVNGIDAQAAGRVAIAGGTTTVELAKGSAKMLGLAASLARPTTVAVKGGGASLDRLTLNVGGGTVQVTGTAAAQLNLNIQLSGISAATVNAFAPGLDAAGIISGATRITGAAADPNIGYQLDLKGAQTAQTRDAGFGAMSVTSTGTYGASVLKFTATVGEGSGLGMKGGGTINVGARNLSLDFSGQVPFGFLTKRLAAQGLALSGTSNVSLTLRGSLASPAVSGRITASGVRLVDARSGLAVNSIAADISIASGVATISRLTGALSTGGSLSGSGTVGIDSAKGFPANLSVKLADARYTDGRIVTTNLDGEVALKGALVAQPLLSGTINLDKTVITVPDRLPGSAAALGVKHKNAPAAVRRQAEAMRPAASGNSGTGLTLDLTVNAPQRIFVQGRGLDAELGGSIRLTGPLSSPHAIGEFTLRRGRMMLLTRRLDFTRGTLGFSGSLIPTIDFAAESVVSDATVTVGVSGIATDPKFTFTSSPSLPQDEVLARLVFGRSLSNLSALQVAQLADAAAQLSGKGGSGSLLNSLRGKLGVDDLDVKTNEQGRAAVTAGKYLNDRTYLSLEKGEGAGSGKARIDLDVGRGVKLRGEASDDGSAKGGIFYEREY